MGGRALGMLTDRLTDQQRRDVISILCPKLEMIHSIVISPLGAPEKTSHGDVDLVVSGEKLMDSQNAVKEIKNMGLTNKTNNSYLYQLSIEDGQVIKVQVDIIEVETQYLEMYLFTINYGDLGMILGYICHSFQFSINSHGLFYRIYEGSGFKKYLITANVAEVCEILGLDYSRWQHGFNTKRDIFDWLLVLRPKIVHKTNEIRNRADRRSDDRPMYQEFLIFNTERLQNSLLAQQESNWRDEYCDAFRNSERFRKVVQPLIDQDRAIARNSERMRRLLNKQMILDTLGDPNLTGPALGSWFSRLRSVIDVESDTTETVRQKLLVLRDFS
ncbi:MAG: hypothetical protein EOP45_08840 [Sphingobacteriaceae bacterium]|nr:MAG: hypothetical protein EOP45_08840 [Sphingobacteriaceae bacterium]